MCSLEAIILRYLTEALYEGTTLLFPITAEVQAQGFDVEGDLYSMVQYRRGGGAAVAAAAASAAASSVPPPLPTSGRPVKAAAPPPPKPLFESAKLLLAAAASAASSQLQAFTGINLGFAQQSPGTGADQAPLTTGYSKVGFIVKKDRKSKGWRSFFFAIHASMQRLYYFESDSVCSVVQWSAHKAVKSLDHFLHRPSSPMV